MEPETTEPIHGKFRLRRTSPISTSLYASVAVASKIYINWVYICNIPLYVRYNPVFHIQTNVLFEVLLALHTIKLIGVYFYLRETLASTFRKLKIWYWLGAIMKWGLLFCEWNFIDEKRLMLSNFVFAEYWIGFVHSKFISSKCEDFLKSFREYIVISSYRSGWIFSKTWRTSQSFYSCPFRLILELISLLHLIHMYDRILAGFDGSTRNLETVFRRKFNPPPIVLYFYPLYIFFRFPHPLIFQYSYTKIQKLTVS